jgi:hypothetical protein
MPPVLHRMPVLRAALVLVALVVLAGCGSEPTESRVADLDTTTTTERRGRSAGDADVVSAADHGVTGDGRTDDTDALLEAIDQAAERSVPLDIPAGTYVISETLELPTGVPAVRLHDEAVIRQTVDAPVFARRGSASAGPWLVSGADEGAGSVRIEDPSAALEEGDWLLVASERTVHRGKKFRLGSLRRVTAIDDDQIELDRPLHRDLSEGTTGYRIGLAPPVTVTGGVVEHAQPEDAFAPLVLLEWVERPVVDGVEIRNCGGSGIKTVGTVDGEIDVDVHDCLDDHDGKRFGNGRHYGYGVEVTGPTRDLEVTGTAHSVRHAFTTNGSFPLDDRRLVNVGEPENIDVSMDVWDTTSSGLDTHELGVDIRFHDCTVEQAGRYLREGDADFKEGGFGIFIRSPRTIVENCEVSGSARTGIAVSAPAPGFDPWSPEDAPRIVGTSIVDTLGRAGVEIKQPAVLDDVVVSGTHRFGIQFYPGADETVVRESTIDLDGSAKTIAFVNPPLSVRFKGNDVDTDVIEVG